MRCLCHLGSVAGHLLGDSGQSFTFARTRLLAREQSKTRCLGLRPIPDQIDGPGRTVLDVSTGYSRVYLHVADPSLVVRVCPRIHEAVY